MIVYRKRNTFLQQLHPLTGVMLIISYIIVSLIINNPIYLSIIFISIILLSIIDGCFQDIFSYAKFIIPVAFLIIIFNPLVSHNGNTIIYRGSINIPIYGVITITLEALLFGILMGFRIIIITTIFGFGNLIIHPDRTFAFFSKFLKKSSLLMSMTIRFFPALLNSYNNIIEVERLRGNLVSDKNFKQRVKGQGNIINILFMSSLEDAVDVSESMYSRGFGLGKRSTYFKEKIGGTDIILDIILILLLIYIYYFIKKGFNTMNFYPHCDNPISILNIQGFILCILFFIPSVINWGVNMWKR